MNIDQPKCPSCESDDLEVRTDRRIQCVACGYIFPEPSTIGPDDDTPVRRGPDLRAWEDTKPMDVDQENEDD